MGWSNLFIKDEGPTTEKPSTAEQKPPVSTTALPVTNTFVQSPIVQGTPDDKFIAMLEAVIADNNIPGLDYVEFKAAIDKMKSLPMDETTKFMSAYSIFESQGCTKQTLIDSIDKYMAMIVKEQEHFDVEMKASFTEKVESKTLEIENSRKEIVELNNKIVELNNFIMSTTQETQQEEMKLRMADSNFKQSVQRVISVMQSDKEKITNYLK